MMLRQSRVIEDEEDDRSGYGRVLADIDEMMLDGPKGDDKIKKSSKSIRSTSELSVYLNRDMLKGICIAFFTVVLLFQMIEYAGKFSESLKKIKTVRRSNKRNHDKSKLIDIDEDEDKYDPTINLGQSNAFVSTPKEEDNPLAVAQFDPFTTTKSIKHGVMLPGLMQQQAQETQQAFQKAMMLQKQVLLAQQLEMNKKSLEDSDTQNRNNIESEADTDISLKNSTDPNIPEDFSSIKKESSATMPTVLVEEILERLSNFRDASQTFNKRDVPMYFHIPKAGGSTVKDIIGSCFRMVMATEFGITDGHKNDKTIDVVFPRVPGLADIEERSPFVNVDVTTVAGIERAAKMGFADSGLAGCVASPFLFEANNLFTETAQGRLFAVFRHPVDRAVSMFYYLQVADWEPTYMPALQNWTLKKYATSSVIENNWITRQLTNALSGELNDTHLKAAMEVIRRKFFVGIMTKLEESMTRFEKFFHWKFRVNPPYQEECRARLIGRGSNSNRKNKKGKPVPGDPVWDLIAAQNTYDIQLFELIESLFLEQESWVSEIPDDFRNLDATCCRCDPPTFPPEGFSCPKQEQK